MVRGTRYTVAALAVVATLAPLQAAAVDVTAASVGLSWSAATGPVSGYSIQVSRNGGSYQEVTRVTTTSTRVSGQVGETVRVRVAAFDSQGALGSPSTPSDPINFVQDPAPPPPPPGSGGDPAGDVDGDGTTDALAVNASTGELSALLLNADGTRAWQSIGSPSDRAMRPVGYADTNADGQADVLWRNAKTGANELWRMNGASYTVVALPDEPASYRVAAFRDFSGDGRADALFHDAQSGDSEVWTLTGSGRSAVLAVDPAPEGMALAAVADLDGDTQPDLVWQDSASGALEAWRMNGATPMAVFSLPDAPSRKSTVLGTGDFDGDGTEDLAWHARISKKRREARVWFMDGMNAPSEGTVLRVGKQARLRGVVDLDNDGTADLVVVRKRGFRGYSVSPSGTADANGVMQWQTQAIDLNEVPASKRWHFLVLQ